MPKKSKIVQELQVLADLEPEDVEDGNDNVQAEKIESAPIASKEKKPRTEKQLEAFKKARETARINAEKRQEERRIIAEHDRKLLEEKLVKKAISVKKKEIKKQAVLDSISDDDTDIQEIQKLKKRIAPNPIIPSKPKFYFV